MSTFESTVVFVGENFHRLMFDEGELFRSERDYREDVVSGPLAQFSYGSGTYRLSVVPDRVAVVHKADAMLSDDLYRATASVAESIRAHQQPHEVQALGMNVEARLTQVGKGLSGTNFCRGLTDSATLERLTDARFGEGFIRLVYYREGVRYTVRVEPDQASAGANLFIHVNAHQNVTGQEDLRPRIALMEHVRAYLMALYRRIEAGFGGDQ